MYLREPTHIVVGAGSAGCIVAARIAENPVFNVLLIEAGSDYDSTSANVPYGVQDARRVPMKGQSEKYDPEIDWNLVVDLPNAQAMTAPQAKIMGGGSSINGGTALRNTEIDCKEWMQLGNGAWDYTSVCKIYERLGNDEGRGTQGSHPITRTAPEGVGQIQNAFVQGAISCGFTPVFDLNASGSEGVGPSPVCRRGNKRVSASATFVDPIRKRMNFNVLASTTVHTVLFEESVTVGVKLANGRTIRASKEVVLCAGAIFSPAILQRSGIGPIDLLSGLGLPTITNLPVGERLSDHPCIPVVTRPRPGAYAEGDYSLQMQARWSSSFRPRSTDFQMVCFSYLYVQPSDTRIGERSLAGTTTGHVAGIGCNLNKPTSLGTVRIVSKDASKPPKVDPSYLQTDYDRAAAREIVRKAYDVLMSPPMQLLLHEPIGLERPVLESENLLDEWIGTQFSTTYHFCGTCRMASREHGGVVDQSGIVYGVQGLRVCDASIIPTVPAANTMWPTMMFAEAIGSSIRDGLPIHPCEDSSEAKL